MCILQIEWNYRKRSFNYDGSEWSGLKKFCDYAKTLSSTEALARLLGTTS